ncbi:hypothetical protein [Salibacter sp.]|uniref:hypothetical protein n=1 Tax=Salibacter sp. TaxID=2010995 RepID=UPI0028705565|nr:hypothetical protein [Salibacter sp.]MDR9487042.1 hypothetical protein [Salibacter sp.]
MRLISGPHFEEFNDIIQTNDGGYAFCGYTNTEAESEKDILIVKTDCYGKTEWMQKVSNEHSDYGKSIIQLSTGDYLISATYMENQLVAHGNSQSAQLIKIAENGELLWKRDEDSHVSNQEIRKTKDENLLLFSSYENGDYTLKKITPSGNELWKKTYEIVGTITDVKVYDNGEIMLSGSSSDSIVLTKLSRQGDTIWAKKSARGNSIGLVVSDSSIFVNSEQRKSNTEFEYFISKFDFKGDLVWQKPLEEFGVNTSNLITKTHDNHLLIVFNYSTGLKFLKLNSIDATVLNETQLNLPNSFFKDLISTDDNGFILCGRNRISLGNSEGLVVKTDQYGN